MRDSYKLTPQLFQWTLDNIRNLTSGPHGSFWYFLVLFVAVHWLENEKDKKWKVSSAATRPFKTLEPALSPSYDSPPSYKLPWAPMRPWEICRFPEVWITYYLIIFLWKSTVQFWIVSITFGGCFLAQTSGKLKMVNLG